MSYFFLVGKETVWNPALDPGLIYVGFVRSVEAALKLDSGLGTPYPNDEAVIEVNQFSYFIDTLIEEVSKSEHDIFVMQLRSVILPGMVMLERAGRPVTIYRDNVELLALEAAALSTRMAS